MKSPLRELDDDARAVIANLINTTRHAALAVSDPEDSLPNISRIAFVRGTGGVLMSLISDLATHSAALRANPDCAILIGEPETKGDPLTHPRLSLRVLASIVPHGDPRHAELARDYLEHQPKAKLYIGFADFSIVTFEVRSGLLNAGFGKAYPLDGAEFGSF